MWINQQVNQEPAPLLSRAEYFFDTDPGPGGATLLEIIPKEVVDTMLKITIPLLSQGKHNLGLRFQNEQNIWSSSGNQFFEVIDCLIPQPRFFSTSICAGFETLIGDNSYNVQPGAEYAWDVDSDGNIDYFTAAGHLAHIFPSEGEYLVELTITNPGGCVGRFSSLLKVDPSPAKPEIVIDGGNPWLCDGETLSLSVTEKYHVYEWNTLENTESININTGGRYRVEVGNLHGCKSISNFIQIDLYGRYEGNSETTFAKEMNLFLAIWCSHGKENTQRNS